MLLRSSVPPDPTYEAGSMLLVLPVPFRLQGGRLLFESQACNGLNRWADNFSHVVVAAPVMPEYLATADKTIVWEDTATAVDSRVNCIQLPWAYGLPEFVRTWRPFRKLLADQIRRCQYLQFAIGGLVGDWGALAATEAKKQGRAYAIHTDRVEADLLRKLSAVHHGPRAWKQRLEASLMDKYHRSVIKGCAVGLWHGQECYAAYSPWCKNNHLVHDVHAKKSDAIPAAQLEEKLNRVSSDVELRIAYAGRMSAMKAPLEWVRAVSRARDFGIPLRATWYGDGELRPQMEAEIAALKLGDTVQLTGFVSDRKVLLDGLRDAHLMSFTHITPESPRCLLEALICGTPLVGYDNPFARDLTANLGGGTYVSMHNWEALGSRIAELASKRGELRQLIADAAANGRRFNDDEVFRERSEIIKTSLAS